ncbi:hypothetical protein BGZ63DRAFT_403272 [Mariannaea sp. PMI_226]|nr:hypothetical protein BGZ63DRAFT_403272 [Mariannaea sp. PMI_226]
MPIDWRLYESDITKLYITENKTIQETVNSLNKKYGIRITPQQLKVRFKGLKNLKAGEWRVVNHELARLRSQGKSCDVFMHGRQLEPERVKRENRRYSNKPSEDELLKIRLGIDTVGQHRIELRQPLTTQIRTLPLESSSASFDFTADLSSGSSGSDLEVMKTVSETFLDSIGVDQMELDHDTIRQLTPQYAPIINPMPSHSLLETGQSILNSCSTAHWSDNTASNGKELVWVNSQQAVAEEFGRSPLLLNSILSPSLQQSFDFVNSTMFPYDLFWDSPAHSGVLQQKEATLLSQLAKVHRGLQSSVNLVQKYFHIQTEMYLEGELDLELRSLFLVITYLASNNLVPRNRIQSLVQALIGKAMANEDTAYFLTVLQIRFQYDISPIHLILKAMCHSQLPVSRYESKSYVLLDRYPSQCLWVLGKATQQDISGSLGYDLLRAAVFINHLEMVMLLVELGVDVNQPTYDVRTRGKTAILATAASCGSVDILKFLISVGADVNRGYDKGQDTTAFAFAAAVEAGRHEAVLVLLEAKAKVDLTLASWARNKLNISMDRWPDIHALLPQHVVAADDNKTETTLMVESAYRDTRPLADFLVGTDIVDDEFLERGLCYAVKMADVVAVGTFLRRGVDVNARKYRSLMKGLSDNSTSDDCAIEDITRDDHGDGDCGEGHDMSILGPEALEIATGGEHCDCFSPIHECGSLLDAGCPINSYGRLGLSALQAAARRGHLALVQFLICQGADVNFPANPHRHGRGRTALQAAAEGSHRKVMEYLVQAGANINAPPAKGPNGVTVLEAIARAAAPMTRRGRAEQMITFKWLLALGAPVNHPSGESGRLLHDMIGSEFDTSCLKLIIDRAATLESLAFRPRPFEFGLDPKMRLTPLQLAAGMYNLEGVQLLIDSGARVCASPAHPLGFTPLQAAASGHDFLASTYSEHDFARQNQVVELLLRHGAEVNDAPSPNGGVTALQGACSRIYPNIEVIQLLLSKGADVNAKPAPIFGFTALQGASIGGHIHIVKLLLENGADINAPSAREHGRTAVEGAAEHGRSDIVRLLLNQGARPDSETGFSRAIELAKENDHWHIVRLLEDHQRSCGLEYMIDWNMVGRFDTDIQGNYE